MVGMTRTLDVVGGNRNMNILQLGLSSIFSTMVFLSYEYIKQA